SNELQPRIEAVALAFYGFDDRRQRLQCLGGHGLPDEAARLQAIRLEDGLVGQCARTRQPLLVRELPASYLNIRSGLGQAAPSNLLLLPQVQQAQLVAVVANACFGDFSDHHPQQRP
ncbi:GAF domain-containing protein, partial [Escherichia coli]|uniref:GAF domain-containing protein n=1 Tax=Escherichia coli TaxID=562 RepID=UPI0021198424